MHHIFWFSKVGVTQNNYPGVLAPPKKKKKKKIQSDIVTQYPPEKRKRKWFFVVAIMAFLLSIDTVVSEHASSALCTPWLLNVAQLKMNHVLRQGEGTSWTFTGNVNHVLIGDMNHFWKARFQGQANPGICFISCLEYRWLDCSLTQSNTVPV